MKQTFLPLTLVFFLACSFQNDKADKNRITKNDTVMAEQLIYKGRVVEVWVSKAIFHSPTNNNFFMRFTIQNTSNKTVGIDLSNYWKVIYPNQWGIHKKPYREVVDECQQLICFLYHTSTTLKETINYAHEQHRIVTPFYLD